MLCNIQQLGSYIYICIIDELKCNIPASFRDGVGCQLIIAVPISVRRVGVTASR